MTASMRGTAALPAVVLVEDNPDDALLIREAYRRARVPHPLHVVADGVDALSLVLEPSSEMAPALLLLDLKLPRRSGLEVIASLRASARTMTMPIVVLSSSPERDDVAASYAAGANSYLVKPLEFTSLEKLLRYTLQYWLGHNEPPPQVRG